MQTRKNSTRVYSLIIFFFFLMLFITFVEQRHDLVFLEIFVVGIARARVSKFLKTRLGGHVSMTVNSLMSSSGMAWVIHFINFFSISLAFPFFEGKREFSPDVSRSIYICDNMLRLEFAPGVARIVKKKKEERSICNILLYPNLSQTLRTRFLFFLFLV